MIIIVIFYILFSCWVFETQHVFHSEHISIQISTFQALDSHVWLTATILDSTGLSHTPGIILQLCCAWRGAGGGPPLPLPTSVQVQDLTHLWASALG